MPASPYRPFALVGSLAAVAGIVGMNLWLLAYFGGARLLEDRPLAGLDFDTHISQVWRVLEGLEGWGQTWVYDVQHLAGYPNGTIFDADNKGWELFTYLLTRLGFSAAQGFNAFVLAAHLLVAPVSYLAARLFRMERGPALVAAASGVLYWYFDGWMHWCWYVGMVAWAFASYLCLLPLSLYYRFTEDRRAWQAVTCGLLLGLCHLVHPYSFFVLAAPMIALTWRARRDLGRRGWAWVAFVVAVTLAMNAWWLRVAFRFWHYVLDSSYFAATGPVDAFWDLLGLLTEPASTGIIGKRTAFRVSFVGCAIVASIAWRRRGDRRTLPFTVALVTLLVVTYFGGLTWLSHIQPYRHVGPTGFIAILCTAGLVDLAARQQVWRTFGRPARAALAILAVPAFLHLTRDALYFLVRSLPTPAPLPHGERVAYTALGYPEHGDYRYVDWHAEALADWVRRHDDGTGRFLVEGWTTGEQLTWKTRAQVLGGFIWRNLDHSWANFFRRRPQGIAHEDELREYFETYAVRWVIVSSGAPWWDRSPLLEKVAELPPGFRVYRTKQEVSLLAEGRGTLRAETNRLTVTGSDPDEDLVLRYHWLETLVCEPDCAIRREKVPGDPVGFIRIPAPHPVDLVVRNRY